MLLLILMIYLSVGLVSGQLKGTMVMEADPIADKHTEGRFSFRALYTIMATKSFPSRFIRERETVMDFLSSRYHC